MAVHIIRLGTPRLPGEGLRIGTVRRPPRGVRREDYARLDYYDVWYPNLAPTADLMKEAQQAIREDDEAAWRRFVRGFTAQMAQPDASHTLDLLAALSHRTDLAVGCYCENEARCHRSVLRELLQKRGAEVR
ncbi:DUF488 domain-containing protein [Cupriavidus sp. AU9028]|uniref:DUF488 domain-containing protein n=1 Tax=Cupriavidus sp. AU9028 TaxID=2871157 RepID=UPI001C93C9E5|nr:DUF488 family protein [Cupriavidus sp. AU9028]MBY4898972.1 DUF488 family protein [Cupriavidus sp. AU9028]